MDLYLDLGLFIEFIHKVNFCCLLYRFLSMWLNATWVQIEEGKQDKAMKSVCFAQDMADLSIKIFCFIQLYLL